MSTPPEQFARIAGKVSLADLGRKLVVIVGVGSLGSQIARELAHSGVGYMRFVDGDRLQEENLIRHALPRRWVGRNKAEALTLYLSGEVPTLQAWAVGHNVTDDVSDSELDELLDDADLIVASTDDRRTQRRLGQRARELNLFTVFPGLYEDDGGEVFVQRRANLPCFSCWDEFRPADAALRAAVALNIDTLPILFLAVELCLGLLDRRSVYSRRLAPRPSEQLPVLFRLAVRDELALGVPAFSKRDDCPVCGAASSQLPPTGATFGRPTRSARTVLGRREGESRLDRLSNLLADSSSVLFWFAVLLAAIAFTASPAFLMTHVFNRTGPLQLIVGPICFIWALAGIAAVGAAGWALLVVVVESLGRLIGRLPWRQLAVVAGGAMVVLWLVNSVSLPSFSSSSDTWKPYPVSFRPCESAPPPPHTSGRSLQCHPKNVAISVVLGNTGSNDWIYREVPPEGVYVFGACPREMPALHAFYIGDERVGSLLCKYDSTGHVVLVWTDLRAVTYSIATFPASYSLGAAYNWWMTHAYEGGPPPTPAPRD